MQISRMAAIAAAFGALALGASSAFGATEVVATGLDNPRGIGFAPDGSLFVAEAGHGGTGQCLTNSGNENVCYGETGALTRINGDGSVTRVVTGLPSLAGETGFGATGPDDVSFLGDGTARVTVGLGAAAAARASIGPKGALFGSVLQVSRGGQYRRVADLAAFEAAVNPAGGATDSNPYGVLALPGRAVVADAGGNSLVEAAVNGQTRLLAVFPTRPVTVAMPPLTNFPMQAVPTAVALGPDGYLYVGQLTGFPFPKGGANVYRVPPDGGVPEVYANGFSTIIDLTFDNDGNLYVLQIGNGFVGGTTPPIAAPGSLWKIPAGGGQPMQVPTSRPLIFPGGVAAAPDGSLYVTNKGTFPASEGGGEVLRITP